MFFKNFIKIITSLSGAISFLIGISIISIPSYYFIEGDLIIGNLGNTFYMWEVFLTIVISLLFGIFLAATVYKIRYFKTQSTAIGSIGGFLGILVAGCPACSITVASYIGLAGIISIFPFYGIELKFLSVLLLLYANYATIGDLETCKIILSSHKKLGIQKQ